MGSVFLTLGSTLVHVQPARRPSTLTDTHPPSTLSPLPLVCENIGRRHRPSWTPVTAPTDLLCNGSTCHQARHYLAGDTATVLPSGSTTTSRCPFEEAATVFADPLALAIEDAVHEDRMLLLGMSVRLQVLLVVHAELDEDSIRLISARRATSHERRRYEEGE